MAQVVGEVQKETELLDAEVGAGECCQPTPGVGGLDERLQHVEGGAFNAVAEKEALGAGEAVEGGSSEE